MGRQADCSFTDFKVALLWCDTFCVDVIIVVCRLSVWHSDKERDCPHGRAAPIAMDGDAVRIGGGLALRSHRQVFVRQ